MKSWIRACYEHYDFIFYIPDFKILILFFRFLFFYLLKCMNSLIYLIPLYQYFESISKVVLYKNCQVQVFHLIFIYCIFIFMSKYCPSLSCWLSKLISYWRYIKLKYLKLKLFVNFNLHSKFLLKGICHWKDRAKFQCLTLFLKTAKISSIYQSYMRNLLTFFVLNRFDKKAITAGGFPPSFSLHVKVDYEWYKIRK